MTVTSAATTEHGHDTSVRWRALGSAVLPAAGVLVVQLVLFPLPAGAWLQGVVLGLLNALVVLGLMLVYRANRVINFAQASMGAFPAALAVGLILFSGLPYLLALGIGVVAAIAVGVLTDLVIIRRFRRSPRLILTVATIGLAQMYAVGALVVPRLWDRQVLVSSNGDGGYRAPLDLHVTVGQQVFRSDDVMAIVVSVVCLVAVSLFLRGTDVGTAIRAAADRGDRASMLGVPVLRLETAVWAVASVLSFLGVFLQGAILGFPITAALGLSTLVAALAAMALGAFESMPAALTAAVAIGVLEQGRGVAQRLSPRGGLRRPGRRGARRPPPPAHDEAPRRRVRHDLAVEHGAARRSRRAAPASRGPHRPLGGRRAGARRRGRHAARALTEPGVPGRHHLCLRHPRHLGGRAHRLGRRGHARPDGLRRGRRRAGHARIDRVAVGPHPRPALRRRGRCARRDRRGHPVAAAARDLPRRHHARVLVGRERLAVQPGPVLLDPDDGADPAQAARGLVAREPGGDVRGRASASWSSRSSPLVGHPAQPGRSPPAGRARQRARCPGLRRAGQVGADRWRSPSPGSSPRSPAR